MRKSTIEVQTGRSGSSVAFNARGKGGRLYSGRKYYRKKVVWTCDECRAASDSIPSWTGKVLWWGAAVIGIAWLFSD